jgi:hypothetical protein
MNVNENQLKYLVTIWPLEGVVNTVLIPVELALQPWNKDPTEDHAKCATVSKLKLSEN